MIARSTRTTSSISLRKRSPRVRDPVDRVASAPQFPEVPSRTRNERLRRRYLDSGNQQGQDTKTASHNSTKPKPTGGQGCVSVEVIIDQRAGKQCQPKRNQRRMRPAPACRPWKQGGKADQAGRNRQGVYPARSHCSQQRGHPPHPPQERENDGWIKTRRCQRKPALGATAGHEQETDCLRHQAGEAKADCRARKFSRRHDLQWPQAAGQTIRPFSQCIWHLPAGSLDGARAATCISARSARR